MANLGRSCFEPETRAGKQAGRIGDFGPGDRHIAD